MYWIMINFHFKDKLLLLYVDGYNNELNFLLFDYF